MKQKLLLALLALFTLGGSNLFAQTWTGNEVAEGDFYLYNVGQRKWLTSGNSWGTQGSLTTTGGFDCSLELSNGKYAINTKMRTNNKENGPGYLGNNGYVDGENPTYFEFIQASRTDGIIAYFIKDGENSFKYSGSGNTCDFGTETGDNAQWILVTKQNRIDALANATEDSPIDATFYIEGANFGRYDVNRNGKWQGSPAQGGLNTNMCAEKFCGSAGVTFNVYQSFAAPNGRYKLMVQGFDRWNDGTTYNALPAQTARENGTETINAYIYINDTKQDLKSILENIMTTTGDGSYTEVTGGSVPQDMNAASYAFNQGLYENELTVEVSSKQITVGVKCDGSVAREWTIFDNFRLYYLGPLDLSVFETALADAVAAAEATEGTVPSAAYNAIAAVVSEYNKTYDNEDGYSTAINAINNAVATYASQEIVDAYNYYKTIKAAVLAINSDIDTADADAKAEAVTTADQTEAVVAVRAALMNYLNNSGAKDVNLTDALLTNPGFELGNVNGWTNSGAQSAAAQGNKQFDNTQGNYYAERWHAAGTVDLNQTVSSLAAGVYEIGAYLYTDTNDGKLYANDVKTSFSTSGWYTVSVAVDNDASIKFGASCTLTGSTWICMDGFTLTYKGSLPDVTPVEGKMNKDVAAAQTEAITAYNAERTVANYNAAIAAINAAQASVDAYASAATAINKAKEIKNNHNFATADALTTFADAIAAIENPYNEGTLTDDVAKNAGITLGTAVSAWHGNNNAAAVVYLRDGFSLGDFEADPALHVNTWSTEGDNDGSGFSVPFYESWTAASSLPESTITGSLSDLPTGLYKVSALVRVCANNEAAATEATGVTMNVNGGTAVDVTEGNQVGDSQFQLKSYEAEGLVKDGNLTVTFNIAADNNIYWLSFKNVKYEKVRDLTPEEQAVTPTGIRLDKTEVTLTATENTVILTPTFDPENATTTVTWTTSDANIATVADGVVTGVAPGTATITVASTLNADVKATCTVTVSYPESVVPETYYKNEGATRTVYTLGENLIKNGSFEYPNPVYAWTASSNYSTAALASNFTINTTGGMYDGAYLTGNGVGAADQKSLTKLIPVESGKTYYFSVYTSGKAPNASNQNYNALFKLTNEKKEDGTITKFNWPQGADKETSDWNKTEFIFTADESHPYVGIRLSWAAGAKFDEFILAEVNATTEGNVDYVIDAIPTANIGDKPFQYSQSAIDAANALVQGEATVEDVENAYAAVTTVNAPAEGQLFNVVLTYNGWTYDNKAMTYIANGRTDAGNYNIQYKEVANENLAQAFTFTKVEGNNYKMSQIDADGVARYISTGVPYSGNTSQIRTTTNADDALLVTVIPTATEGKWNLRNTAANQYIGSQDAGVYTVNSHIDFVLQEAQKPSITINTTAAGWGTTILPFAVNEIPEGVKVYSCAAVDGATLTLKEVDALEANKPYIIEGAWNATLTGDAQGTALTYTEGLLTGVYAPQIAPAGSYVLQKQNGVVAFYKVAEGENMQPTVGANRAYVTVPNSSAKMFSFGGDATGISAIDALLNGDAEIYNVSGMKQNSLQKGMNIIKMSDGTTRKVMVK